MNQYDWIDAGYRVFGLNGGNPDGSCKCGNLECKAAFKHPIASNWQFTPEWSDDQLEVMEMTGQFSTGYGILLKELLVVDVDARNGGVEAFERLCATLSIDLLGLSGLAVRTGSGGGSMHLYFKAPQGVALMQHLHDYKGLDLKSSGFTVGPGSLHASGSEYEVIHGHPDDITEAPQELIAILTRPDTYRAEYQGDTMDVTEQDLADMISHVSPNCDHDTWIKCGMALHHATGGTGFAIWDEWSLKGDEYHGRAKMEQRWHSFGKSANPVTLGTLVFHAEEGGWQQSVTFNPTVEFDDFDAEPAVDLLRPPGFVGEVCKWINSQSRYPRENLAVAAALVAMGNVCGLRYTDEEEVTANLFAMCIAGSATGKEAILKSAEKIHVAAGIQRASVSNIKSEQEITRNLIDNQAAFYLIDEFGIHLKKIVDSKEAYHSGVIGTLMSTYSKANSWLTLGGDMRRDITKAFSSELKSARSAVAENEDPTGSVARRIPQLERALDNLDNFGLERPFVSLIGLSTGVTFDELVTFEQATNGFFSRGLIISEKETVPARKEGFKAQPMGDRMKMTLSGIYDGGHFNQENKRVEFYGDRVVIKTEPEAKALQDDVYRHFHAQAHSLKPFSLEPIPLRGTELVAKISLILAAPSGVRTVEHVQWAFEFVKRDISEKCRLVTVNTESKEDPSRAVIAKIMGLVDKEHGETEGVLVNRCKKWPKKNVVAILEKMVTDGMLVVAEVQNPTNGRKVIKYLAGERK